MTVLLEYIDCALVTHGWIVHYSSVVFGLISYLLLKGPSTVMNPLTFKFSTHSLQLFVW